MLTLPVHSRRIAELHFDPETRRLRVTFRDGTVHSIDHIDPIKVMRLIGKIPAERSVYFQTRP